MFAASRGEGWRPSGVASRPAVVEVLYFSDKQVTAKLRERAQASPRLLVVSGTRHGPAMRPVAQREPFATLQRTLGARVDQVVCADEGTVEGMWRDPLGTLADALFPTDSASAYQAASGYLVLLRGVVQAVVKKGERPEDDAEELWRVLARLDPTLPPAPERAGPRERARRRASGPQQPEAQARGALKDPYQVLGVPRGTPKDQVRKAFRALVAQYHPDKVAHLAAEFRALAEERTRELTAAWQQIDGG